MSENTAVAVVIVAFFVGAVTIVGIAVSADSANREVCAANQGSWVVGSCVRFDAEPVE